MKIIQIYIEVRETPIDPDDKFTFPAPRGVAVAPVVTDKVKAVVAEMTFSERVDLMRGPEAEAEGID